MKTIKDYRTIGTALLLAGAVLLGQFSMMQVFKQEKSEAATSYKAMYRLYNPNSGEHFYTASSGERDTLKRVGWSYEGVAWYAPTSGAPVYRMYNPNAGDHHYTTSAAEKNNLVTVGWRYEGIGWNSGGAIPLYRCYNPNAIAGSHHYTTSGSEKNNLVTVGWRYEGIGWYGVNPSQSGGSSSGGSSGRSSGGSSSGTSGTPSTNPTVQPVQHTHTWTKYVKQAAYDELVFERTNSVSVGTAFTGNMTYPGDTGKDAARKWDLDAYYTGISQSSTLVPYFTSHTVHHDAVYGYKCSCGATK